MTGRKRLAAKLIALSSVLAVAGGGAYCYTSGAAPWELLTERGAAGKAELKPQGAADSTLDAVASAWADPKAARYADSRATQPARSAERTTARTDEESTPESQTALSTTSRYDRYVAAQTGSASASDRTDTFSPLPMGASEQSTGGDSKAALPANDSAADAHSADLSPLAPTVVRGQNPADAPPATTADTNSTRELPAGGAADAMRLADEPAAAGSTLGAAAARARQAFNEPPAAPGGDRYGATSGVSRGGKDESRTSSPGIQLNPFATQASQTPATAGREPLAANAAAAPTATPVASPTVASQALSPTSGLSGEGVPAAVSDYRQAAARGALAPSSYGGTASGYSTQQPQRLTDGGEPSGGSEIGLLAPMGDSPGGQEGTGKPGERALEGDQNLALVIQKLAPPEIQVGKPAKFLLKVRNTGNQAAAEVVVRDEVPQGTRLVSTSPIAEITGSQLQWRMGTLSIGEERTIELQLMPTAEGEIGSVATVNYSAQASIKTRSTMPQLALNMTAPKQVLVGQEERVKILLNNPGSGDATGVMLFENVPDNVKHAAGPALEFEIGTLRAGETRELELVLKADKPGTVTNTLSARAEGNLQVQQQVEFEVIAPALSVAVAGPERRYLERPATYEVSVENPGTATARDIQLVTKLPKGMKFVRANNMGEYDPSTHAVYWSLAELQEKERGTVELVTMPVESGPQTLEVEGRAQQGLTDQTKQQILVEGLAAIMFEVRDLEDPIEVGKETTYEIRVVNQGTKSATNVQVAVALPHGMQFVSAEGETRNSPQAGGIVFAPLKQLAPKADTVYRVKVQCQQPGDQRVTVEVKTDDLDQPIRREESTRVFGDQ